ncbi:MAG: T9SS type A sorting domain-containing protein [Sporocytophaga sp.]|nr:T9SS type A sorting domain-containing protein [Sporocytophaga sp.]
MIKNFLAPIFVFVSLIANAQDSLVLHLPFSGNANDISSYKNHGIVHGAKLTANRLGQPNEAYLFDGIDDYIEIPDAPSLNPANITLAAWVKVDSIISQTPDIIRKSIFSNATNEQYILRLAYYNTPQTCIKVNSTCVYNPNGWTTNTSPVKVSLENWHFIVATFDSLALRLYTDGKLLSEEKLSSPAPIVKCGSNIRIGTAWRDYPNYFKGIIDDIKIFNKALDECAIKALYHENDLSLVVHLPFSGSTMDESSYENHGIVYGPELTNDRFGNPNSAYSFDGIDDYIEIPDAPSLNPANITLAAWVKADSVVSHTPDIIRKSSFYNATDEQYLLRLAFHNKPQTAIKANTACEFNPNGWTTNTSAEIVPLEDWHFIVSTFDSLTLRLYADGKLISEKTLSSPAPIVKCGSNIRIGAAWSDYPNYFKGTIDDIKIYNRALSDCEIKLLFNSKPDGSTVVTSISSGEDKQGKFIVYPNPVDGAMLYLKDNDLKNFNFEITTIDGKQKLRGKNQEGINISSLTPGTYIISILNEKNKVMSSGQFIKK